MLTLLLLTAALAQPLTLVLAEPPPNGTWWAPDVDVLVVRAAPDAAAAERGRLARGEPFAVLTVDGPGPGCEHWGRLDETAWACLDHASPATREPVVLPRIVAYEPPRPEDYDAYVETGALPDVPVGDGLLPFVYARRWKEWKGRTWADLAAWERGDPSNGTLPVNRRAHFVDVQDTAKGRVFVRADGAVVPEEDVYLFPVSRLAGRDLVRDPLPEGGHAAWAVGWEGTPAWSAPVALDRKGKSAVPPDEVIAYHTALVVEEVAGEPKWWRVVDGTAGPAPRYVESVVGARVWHGAARPEEVGPDEVWVDVDRGNQMLGVYRGDTPLFVTLVSTGLGSKATPLGVTQVFVKKAWTDMRSREGASDDYFVEGVPWAVYFRPMYALHGAYWHWGFGHPASHGCVNLSPHDAAWIYARVLPEAPPGWKEVRPLPDAAATWVRVR